MVERCPHCRQECSPDVSLFDPLVAKMGQAFFDRGEGINWLYLGHDEKNFNGIILHVMKTGTEGIPYARKWLQRNSKYDVTIEEAIQMLWKLRDV